MDENEELLTFFKALADANRLKIVGLLARQPYSVEQLAALLQVGASTVSHHLTKLSEAGLVMAQAHSYYNYYHLQNEKIQQVARKLLDSTTLPALSAEVDANAFDRKVIANYFLPDGTLKALPSQQKKMRAVLRHLVQRFEMGRKYPEKEVNEMFAQFHEDTASLRREMVGYGFMQREGGGGCYWRIEEKEER